MKRCFFIGTILLLALMFSLNVSAQNEREMLRFEPEDSLEDIRFKIEQNGYDFEVEHNRIFDMAPEEKKAFFSRKAPAIKKEFARDEDLGPLASHLGMALPAAFDWRNHNGHSYIGAIRDQGNCGSCYAFGAAAAAEGAWNAAQGLYDANCSDFSEAFIAFCLSQYYDGFYGCEGADYDYEELDAIVKY
ncbi:MAG TPA: C1 family peptidase, partial [Candidatus Sumerlaeota bacterium]|nr:C1 family peptidase [Candidatus Sumerlaeota bacterium]